MQGKQWLKERRNNMTVNILESTLECFKGKRTSIKLYNDIFGEYVDTFENYTFEIENNTLIINDERIEISDIMCLDLLVEDYERVEMIESCDNYYMAFQIAKGHLGGEVICALDKKKETLQKTRKEQMKELTETIKTLLKAKRSKISSNVVLQHLLSNTQHNVKNDTAIEKSALKEIYESINNVIDKISKVDIF